MAYESPELVVMGRADVLVLGTIWPGRDDHSGSLSKPETGFALGLDD